MFKHIGILITLFSSYINHSIFIMWIQTYNKYI